MKETSRQVLALLQERHPGHTRFYRKQINDIASELKLEGADYPHELTTAQFKVHKGLYDFGTIIKTGETAPALALTVDKSTTMQMAGGIGDISAEGFIPVVDDTYTRWGFHDDVVAIMKKRGFFPTFISGLSGNGKSVMIEQASAQLGREYIRVQISPETDEDDLLGGFRLINGETKFHKGPVVKAMETGAILNLDEIDRGTNKIMCLQGVLEGKPIMIKKTGEIVRPAPGFTVFATANTKGKGSEDGRFVAATVIDEAFLERFACTLEQQYPPLAVEKKIVLKHMEKFGALDADFADLLVSWSETIRKTFEADGVDEIVSTRRLCHIVHTFSIFKDRMKAISMCVNRFDTDTKTAFIDLYTKIDKTATEAKLRKTQVSSVPTPTAATKVNKIPF